MRGVYPVADIRAAEAATMAAGPQDALMQRAATALATACAGLLERVYGARVVLLVGAGNNGGDALFAGARLARRGARVSALLVERGRAHEGGVSALEGAGGRILDADPTPLAIADLVVDGIVGIGGRPGLRGRAAALAGVARGAQTIAVDVPSGVDADTGEAGESAVRADLTVTFGALKPGLFVGAGAELSGKVRFVDLGLDLPAAAAFVPEADDVQRVLPRPSPADDKYTRGVVGVVAGSHAYPGAGVLATGSAIDGGAGMVRYAGGAAEAIRARYPEVVVHEGARPGDLRVQAWTVGPGMGTDEQAAELFAEVLATDVPVIVDADGLTLLARRPELVRDRTAPTVLTPHDREFARIAGEVGPDRLAAARRAAAELRAVVLLKGNTTMVADPDGVAYLNPTGTPWLATAGSGDVLSGLIGSLLAAGVAAPLAAAAGAYLHGVAGQLAATDGPPAAPDVLAQLRSAWRAVDRG